MKQRAASLLQTCGGHGTDAAGRPPSGSSEPTSANTTYGRVVQSYSCRGSMKFAPRVALFAPRPLVRIAPARSLRAVSVTPDEPPAAAEVPHIADEAAAEEAASSAKEESSPSADNNERSLVLEAAMRQVPKLGWTMDALTAGASSRGLSPMAHGLLPRGPIELVEHFSAECNAKLAVEMSERVAELDGIEVHNRLLVAMQVRLRMVAPHASTWPHALALRALPANLSNTLRDGHNLSQQLIEACGEDVRSPLMPPPIDPLVKLMSVGAIYGAAELHMLTDQSPELIDTWTFIEREARVWPAPDGASPVGHLTSRFPRALPRHRSRHCVRWPLRTVGCQTSRRRVCCTPF